MKKKRRQHNASVEKSGDSTRCTDSCNSMKRLECQHFLKAVNLNKLRKVAKDKKNICVECLKNKDPVMIDDELFCKSSELWICLQCGHSVCKKSENNHVKKHFETSRSTEHCVMINTFDWTVWCYRCDKNVYHSNSGSKKKILEVTELLKNSIKSNKPIQPKPCIPLCQNEKSSTDNDNKAISNDFPKVGGLTNLGNTCFFNAVLQCLAQTPYLIKVLDDLQVPGQKIVIPGGGFKGADNKEVDLPPIEGVLQKTGTFTPILRKTLTEMQNSNGQVYNPLELLNSLRESTNQYTDGGQHDSHELLRHLLEQVRSEDLQRYKTIILQELDLTEKSKRQCIDSNLKDRVKFYGNQASAKLLGPERIFRGELFSALQCLNCRHYSSRAEPFLDLSLPVLVEKSQSPNLKRKSSGLENSIDSIINSNNSSTQECKKTYKAANKKNRTNRIKNRDITSPSISNPNRISEEKKENVIEFEESDADVEDNIENEDVSMPEIGESGYSSEKPSAVTSPESLSEFRDTEQNTNNLELNVLPVLSDTSSNFHIMQSAYKNSTSPSPTDISMIDITENKSIETAEFSHLISLAHSDITSPEGPTISPMSTPFTSKNTSSTSVSSDEERVSEKIDQPFLKSKSFEQIDLNDQESSMQTSVDLADENSGDNENDTTKLTNGIGDITSGITKLDLSIFSEPSISYSNEGECSIQLCLNQFTKHELMNGNNKVGCAACTERENKGEKEGVKMVCTDSIKKYLISQVPAVLILHLKRFQMQKFSFRKVCKHVSFPMLLDFAPVSKDKRQVYALYGVVVHTGNLCGGHYVSYVKSRAPLKPNDPRWSFLPSKDSFPSDETSSESNLDLKKSETIDLEITDPKITEIQTPPGQWYYISDSRVQKVDEKTVLQKEAYLLFYERIL
ncbi:PREDICTED: ubiquitin carboxyl-terminal hydrolase 45 [Ceratosolen solmsi marchali]|uniref:Ubiquitin carboxyl-terminal hydrolase n=1 Tax=Ceratosolen solmsi marchali TaxID=326594 RepID=A0AAJ7DWC0_9HYME|nr:PREDICTED: ubiquitin carboxyl-terminal hydrolase 45 [Ceratosolen solmsi marchali]